MYDKGWKIAKHHTGVKKGPDRYEIMYVCTLIPDYVHSYFVIH